MKKTLLAGSSAFVLLTLGAGNAMAQSTGQSGGLEEVVVTAQKRSEDVQSVPIAVTAIKGDELTSSGINNTSQLQLAVPSLNYGQNDGYAQPFLRGIGSDITSPGADASVATFIDGVYVESQQSEVTNLLGVDRVEVLAGPQGTLYGRNASGGAINIYTLTPQDELQAKATVGYGNLNALQGSGYVSGAVSDTLDVGIYLAGTDSEGYSKFVHPLAPGQGTHDSSYGARLKAVWSPTSSIKFTGSIEHTYVDSVESVFRNVQPNALGYSATLGSYAATPLIEDYKFATDAPQYQKTGVTTGILREEFDLDFAQLVGITGFRQTDSSVGVDVDGTTAPLVGANAKVGSRQFSQELQLLSRDDSPITWIAGLYYFHERGAWSPLNTFSPIIFQPAPYTEVSSTLPETTMSYAAYAQATIPLNFLTDGLSLTLGDRYSVDRKEEVTATQRFLDSSGTEVLPSVQIPGIKKRWSHASPKVTIDYKTDNALFYATYAQGYKSGLINIASPGSNNSVQPEVLNDYEGGIKTKWLGGRLILNADAYYYDFKNLQVDTTILTSTGVTSVYKNAPSAEADGLELTAEALLTDHLTVNAGVALEESKYQKFNDALFWDLSAPTGNTLVPGVSVAGNSLQRAPKFVGTLGADYNVPLDSGGAIDLHGNLYHTDQFYWDPAHQFRQPGYTLVNASIAYTSPDGHWIGTVWGNNLGDVHRFTYETATNFGVYAQDDAPRTYGVTISWLTP